MTYPSDLSDEQWALVSNYFIRKKRTALRKYPIRELLNAVLYLTKTGCQWRQLPDNYPPWETVYSFFRREKKRGTWEVIMDALVQKKE